ncbi:MAG: protein kinase [Verrucomicrobia bacterium]|nr:protein kinase [Verrucomicrobiota bacterium]
MSETIEQLRAEIERLKQELGALGAAGKGPERAPVSIRGVETFALRIGPDERILHINTAFARHLGIARDDLIGRKMDTLRRSLNREILMAVTRPAEGESLVGTATDDRGKVFRVTTTLQDGMLDVVMEDITDEQQFRNLVQRYVLKDFDRLSDEELRTFRFPERRFMTVSFTDLRGFTKLVEALEPEDVRGIINAYFEEVIRVVETNEATAAHLVGDELIAFYGAPRYFKDHALRAIKTACEQVETVDALYARYRRDGKQMCRCGVGINTGDVVLGNMGSASRQTYTALGTAVNLASRLCGAAGEGQILLTEVTLQAALKALPASWEIAESRSMVESEDLTGIGGKIEGVERLPDELRGRVISIGTGVNSQKKPAEFIFRYLYVLKPKGIAKPLPVITVQRTPYAQPSRMLSDERAVSRPAEIMVGKYRLLETIGEGGMGKVWKARDQFGNTVAIKMLRAGQDASSRQLERFKREAAIMARLSHRNICHIHEIGQAEGATFIAMEYVDGVSLAEVIRHSEETSPAARLRSSQSRGSDWSDLVAEIKEGKKAVPGSRDLAVEPAPVPDAGRKPASGSTVLMLPLQQVLAVVGAVCDAVQFAHEHGVLHRDLKPGNIMIRPDGEPVVMDFGLAKVQAQEHEGETSISIEGQIVGTIEYMAPEQAHSSKHVTERADVYSLGAILYQVLTGQKHFHSSGNLLVDVERLRDHVPVPLRKVSKGIDTDLQTIVLKALQADPARRYASVGQLREDLRRYQAGDPISARPPTITYQLVTRMRKHRVAFSFSAVILLLALIFGGSSYLEWRQQWGDWTEAFAVNFSQVPPAGRNWADWLEDYFTFQNREATAPAKPWPVRNGAMEMKQHEWCWLRNVRIRGDTKVVVKLRFTGPPEAFQICINARKNLRQWDYNPPGYSCRFGIWQGSMDLITRNEVDRRNDFNSLLVSPATQIFASPGREGQATAANADARNVSLVFQRQGDTVSLQVNGKDVHHDTYLLPLVGKRQAQRDRTEDYENIGIRTWGANVEVLQIAAYRFKLPEKASPIVAGDALVEAGDLMDAIERYKTIAKDYEIVATSISVLALTRGYLLAAQLGDVSLQNYFHGALAKLPPGSWPFFQNDPRAKYLERVLEAETLTLWKEHRYRDALRNFPGIFKANPETRVVVECLQAAHEPLEPGVSEELLQWIARAPDLAGLDVSSFGIADLSALAGVRSLRGLDCRKNRLTNLDVLRSVDQLRALYCGHNQIATLEPVKALNLFELYCNDNRVESLQPLANPALKTLTTLYCGGNRITELSPLEGQPISALDCSHNQIGSLDPIPQLAELSQLYCSSNRIRSVEPLRQAKNLRFLDCSFNAIQSLEPLKDLGLEYLDCSGNPITTLEPFVEARIPPQILIFNGCDALPDAEIERAIAVWSAKGMNFHAGAGRLLLALKHGDFDKVRLLGSEFEGHRYLFVQNRLTASEAEQFCQKLGGHLVTITSARENEFLKQITPSGLSCHIGLVISGGNPHWVTGEAVEEKFVPAQTEFRPSDRTVAWKDGLWLPLPQEDKPLPFIIEWG